MQIEGIMTGKEFIEFHSAICAELQQVVKAKNADYSGEDNLDAFKNFKLSDTFGVVSAEEGLFVRMTDKMSRLASFLKQGKLHVKGEAVEDTLQDLCNYSILLIGLLKDRKNDII
jgi:hypothetical protein